MINYLLSRIAQALAVMVAVAFVSFILFNYVGDPVNNMVGQEASLEDRQRIRDELGLNDPFVVQFARFERNVLSGEFGMSLKHRRPVEVMVAERLPATLELVFASAVLALLFGVTAGVYTGLHGRSVIGRKVTWPAAIASRCMLTFSLIGVSLPTFVIGIVLIYVFSVELRWLPSFGRGETVALGWWTTGFLTASGWKALVLPSITLALFQLTLIMRLVRSEMLEVLRTDYIKFARARGLNDRAVHFGHALKNTLIPVITITGLQLGSLVAFSIITETVFQWPGMGLLFVQAVEFADVPVMAAYLVMIGAVFVFINLVVDLLYFAVDPRLRSDRSATARSGA